MAVKNVKSGDLALVSSGRVDTDSTNAGLKQLINDGVNKGRQDTDKTLGDVGTNQGVRTQKPAATAESVSGTSSSEYNSFNNLKYLKSICTFNVDYFITAGVLSHAASVLRKGAFDDVRKSVADLERRTKAAQEEAKKVAADILKKTLKTGQNSTVKSQVVELDPIPIEYDLLNIPWELIVPEDPASSKNTVAALSQSSMADIDNAINASSKTHIPKFSLYIPAGKSQYACPKSVTHKGFSYLGALTKPIFLPINPAASYGGLFGRILAKLSIVRAKDFNSLNSAGALASSRVVVPTNFSDDEPEGSLITLIPSLGDYASIVSPPLFYKSNAVQFGDNKPIVLDDEWKKGISSGSLFATSDKIQYSDSGLVADEVIKHGTDGLTKAELKDRIGGKKDKLIAPYLRRITNEDAPQKAGNAPIPYEEDKAKDFTKLSDAPVSALIKPVPWKKIVSDKYSSTIGVEEIKAGKNLISTSDIPSFQFWMPFISSRAEDADGSAIYSYLEPKGISSFKNLRVIYTPSAPIGFIQAGVTYTGFGQYINSQGVDNLNNYPAIMCDPLIQKYGIGGFGSTTDTKNTYLLPVSNLTKTIFSSVTPLINSDPEFPVTHKYGKRRISLHSAVFRSLMKSFAEYSVQAIDSIKSTISLNMLKSKSKVKTDDPKQFKINLNHLMLLGTSFETIKDGSEIDVFADETQKNLLGPDRDKVYNKGEIDKVVKVEMNEIVSAQIHVGKTINAKGIDDNVKLTSNNISKVLVDSKVESGFIYEGPGTFMTDIQPGEVLTKKKIPSQKPEEPAANGANAATTPEINEIEYGVDGKLSNSVLFSEDLVDINAKNRINAVDIMSSFMGSGSYSDLQQTDKNNEGDFPRKDPQAILSASLVQSFNSLLGSGTIPRMSPSWEPAGTAGQSSNIGGDPYVFTQEANAVKNLGLFSALGVLLKSPEVLYLEHFQDVKTEPLCANSLLFLEKKYPDESGDYGIYTKTSTIDDYITISGSGGNEKIPVKNLPTGSSTLETKHTNIVHEKIEVETKEGFYKYEPWGGFEQGFENYSSRLDKFVLMTSRDNADFTSKEHVYKKVSDYVSELITAILKESSLSESRATSVFTQGEYLLNSSGSNIDTILTKLFAVSKLENVATEYPGSDSVLMDAIFGSIKNKVMAAAVYTAAEHMKKFTISSDVDLSRLIKAIRNKKSIVFTLNSEMQIIDDATADQIRLVILQPTMPQSQAEIIVSNPDEQRKIIKIIAQGIGCFYLRKLIYKKGFPADGPSYIKLDNLVKEINNIYLKSKADPEKLKNIPRYDVVDISDLGKLISSVQEMKESEGFSKADGIGMTFTEAKIPFSNWYDVSESKTFFGNEPVVEYFVPNRAEFPIKIPICLVRPIKRKDSDLAPDYTIYEFIRLDNETLDNFAKGLKLGETDWLDNPNGYKLLVKSVTPTWLTKKLLSSESSLDKVSISARHAALINNILDYIGFCLQCISEVASVKKDLAITPVRPNPLDARERNRSIRRSRIELGADYVGNNISSSGDNPQEEKGIRAYLLKLSDFSNMVRITQEKGPKITKMFPVGLKELNPDSPQKDLSDKSVVETKVIDLGNFSGAQSKYYGTFMRPGYGLPDLVEGIGYRCVIAKTSSILYNDFKPKRFAFLNNLKSGKASLKLSRMIENAVGSSGFNDVIKASEWSNARLAEKTTSIKDQISSFTISNKFKSSYDGFNPTGMNEASIFDIKIGYVSTRPLFSGAVTAKIKTPEIPLEFKGAMENITLGYEGSQPANLLYKLTNGMVNRTADPGTRSTLDASLGKNLYKDITLLTKLNAEAGSSFEEIENKVSSIEKLFRQLATFRIPVKTEVNLIDELKNSVDTAKAKVKDKVQYKNSYDIVVQKIVSLINDDKLRDCGFIEGSHFSFTGRIDETPIMGNSPYPYIYPGGFTEEEIKAPSLGKLNSISTAGPSNETLYDAHPLSFMTSPSAIGLSKRRSIFTGMNVLNGLVREGGNCKFIKKPDAINPYAGIYFFRTNTAFDENLVLANKRKIEGKPDTYRVVVIPDFPSSEKSSKELAIGELTGVNSANISAESIAAFFGSGTLLNGEFYDQLKSQKDKSKKENFKSKDSRDNSNKNYTASMFNTILKHLRLLYTHAKAKQGEEFYSILNGSVFLKPGASPAAGVDANNQRINKYADVLFSTEKLTLELNEGKTLSDAIVAVFGNAENTNLYFPMTLEGDVLYCTGAAISYLQVLYNVFGKKDNNAKGKNNSATKIESAIKILIDRMKPKANNDEFNDFSNSDLFSIMAGGIYTKSFANADGKLSQTSKPGKGIGSVNRLSYTPNISRAEADNKGIFISAQIYIGYSKKDADIFPMAVIDVPSGKSSKKLLAATRTFGEGVKISNVINSNMDMKYATKDVIKIKSKVKKNDKPVSISKLEDTKNKYLFETGVDAVNIFGLSRLWLAYNYFADVTNNASIKTTNGIDKPIKDITLYDITHVDTEYFIKKLGLILNTNKDNQVIDFDVIDPGIKSILGPKYRNKFVSTPDIKTGSAYSKVPFLAGGSFGIGGIVNKNLPDKETFDSPSLNAKEFEVRLGFMSIFWSLFAMKVFVGSSNIGVDIPPAEFLDESNSLENITPTKKPTLGAISTEKSKVYTDIVAWNSSEAELNNYVSKLVISGGKWNKAVSVDSDDEKLQIINANTATAESKVPKLVAGDDAGLSIMSFEK